jgi:carbon starvation protein
MFEALFILTLLETGTRVARFVFQESVGQFSPKLAMGHKTNWWMNGVMSVLVCGAWGFLLYIGNLNTLWGILGISNQLLAAIALAVGTTYILLHSPRRVYALCTAIPLAFVLTTVSTAAVINIRNWWAAAFDPATPAGDTLLLKLAAVLASIMLVLAVVITLDAVRRWVRILTGPATLPPVTVSAAVGESSK